MFMSNIATMTSDQHICLTCSQTIQGLEKYVQHKQNACGLNTDKNNIFEVNDGNAFCTKSILAVSSVKLELASGLIHDTEKSSLIDSCKDVSLILDNEIQKELAKINLSTFLKLVKQKDHPGNWEDVVVYDQGFVTGDNNDKISLKSILEHCRALNVCAMFSEKDSNANNASLKRRKKKPSSKLSNDVTDETNFNHVFALESLNQENLKKDVTPKGGINISPLPPIQRQIVTRLSAGIRKPSTRYFFEEAKILQPEKSRQARKNMPSQNVIPEDANFKDGHSFGLEHFFDKEACNTAQPNEADPTDHSSGDHGVKGVSLELKGFVPHASGFQCKNCNCCTKTGIEVEEHVAIDLEARDKVGNLKGSTACVKCGISLVSNQDMLECPSSHLKEKCLDKISSSGETSCNLGEKEVLVDCVVCRANIYSVSQLLDHLESPCLAKFKTKGLNDEADLAHERSATGDLAEENFRTSNNDRSSTGLSVSSIKRKRGRPPKLLKKKSSIVQFQGSSEKISEVLSLNAVDKDDETSASKQKKEQGCSNNPSEDDHPEDVDTEVVVLKQDNESNDESIRVQEENKIWCKVCGLGFSSQEKLDSHETARTHLRKVDEMKSGDGKNYKCQRCGRLFYALNSLHFHELNHVLADSRQPSLKKTNRIKNEKQEAEFADAKCMALYQQLISENGGSSGKVSCPECGKKISRTGILSHLRQHTGSLPYKCSFCTKQFADVAVMRRHLKVHLGIMYYRCPVCKKQFGRKSTMQAHALREHGASEVEKHGVFPPSHQCCQCGRQFMQLSQLTAHMKLHNKQLKCPHLGCTSLFRYKSELAVHLQTHSAERRFLCDECGYSGKSRHQLKRHQRLHEGDKRYQCKSCSYKTTLAANLRRHERVHTGSKPYKCLYCGYACNTQENLRKHILKTRRHAGKFVYPCQMCSYATNSAQDFQNHLETKHQRDRQTLPSVLVGMYRPDDKNKFDLESSPADIDLSALNGKEKAILGSLKRRLSGSAVIQGTSCKDGPRNIASGKLSNSNAKSSENIVSKGPSNQDLQSLNATKTMPQSLANPQTFQSLHSQNSLPLPQLQQLILPTSQPNSFLNALIQMQASNSTQNNFQLPLLPLNSITSANQPSLILSQPTDQPLNIKFALQLPSNCSQNVIASSTLPGVLSDPTQGANALPEQMVLFLQPTNNKQPLGNNVQSGVSFIFPGIDERENDFAKNGS